MVLSYTKPETKMATTSKIGILGTTLAVFVVFFILATAQGINVFDFIKKILDQILDTFKVLFTFQRPNEEDDENSVRIVEDTSKIQSVEVKPFDSPDLAVKLPVEINAKRQILIAEKEIPMIDEDRTLRKMQEIKNEKNESHIKIELPKPTPNMPVRHSLDHSIQLRSYLTDEDQEYIETFNPSISKFQTIEVNSYGDAGLTSKIYPSQMNCMQPKDLDDIPTTYYKLFQA